MLVVEIIKRKVSEKIAAAKRGVRRFINIELHPAIYVSIVSINAAVFFAYHANLLVSTDATEPSKPHSDWFSSFIPFADLAGLSGSKGHAKSGVASDEHRDDAARALMQGGALELASVNPDFGGPITMGSMQKHLGGAGGTVSAASLEVIPLPHSSRIAFDRSIPPEPQIFTTRPRPIKRGAPSPYLVPPPPPMIPGPDVALWSNNSNIGLPADMPVAYDSPPPGPGSDRAVHAEHVRIRSFHKARQFIVSR